MIWAYPYFRTPPPNIFQTSWSSMDWGQSGWFTAFCNRMLFSLNVAFILRWSCPRAAGRTASQTDRQTDRQTGRQTGRQADRQADRQTDRHIDKVEPCFLVNFNIIKNHVFSRKFYCNSSSCSEDMKIFFFKINYFYWFFWFFGISLLQKQN